MEEKLTTNGPAAAAAADIVVAQEVSSTTQVNEVNKRSIRVQTWRKIEENNCGIGYNAIFNKIPNFVDSAKAAALLATTQEFKDAKNIKVNIDRAQDAVKLEVLNANKNLYVRPVQGSTALFAKVECPIDADEEAKKQIIKVQNSPETRIDIPVENKIELDMVVIGSVVVSRDGYRIGRGNGFVDLDVGILIETGAITPKTIIATTVHDHQVVDTLPINLFQKYDTPVDFIVTPTEVIQVSKRLPRPTGLTWELISDRRTKIVPVLQVLKENAEKTGPVTLKAEDTDVESNSKRRPIQQRRRKFRNRRTKSQTERENENTEDNDGDGQTNISLRQRRRVRFNNRRRTTKPKDELNETDDKEKKQQRPAQRKRPDRNFCVKISNISKGVRIKDLKTELRSRNCNPISITWKGHNGRCFLLFPKKAGSEEETDINKILQSLNDLSLTFQSGESEETVNLAVELLPAKKEEVLIESVDTTTVSNA